MAKYLKAEWPNLSQKLMQQFVMQTVTSQSETQENYPCFITAGLIVLGEINFSIFICSRSSNGS